MVRALQNFFTIPSHDKKHQNDAEGQEKQRHYIIQKVKFISFQGSTVPFAIQQGDFPLLPCMWPYSSKGPLIVENFNLLNKVKHTYSFQK